MSVTCELYGDALIATLSGSIDRKTSPKLSESLLEAAEPATHVVCDLADVTYISSTGYRLLLHVYHLAAAKQGQVALVAPPPEIRETLFATGFREFFVVAQTIDDALEQLARQSAAHAG
ncbi:MAG TPA: STAS domain-containing protein [Lacipirellula sp.]